jgi:hypothetical protein
MKTKVSVRLGDTASRFLLGCSNVSRYINGLCETRRQWVFDAVTTVAELGIEPGTAVYAASTGLWPGKKPEAAKSERARSALELLRSELRGPNADAVKRMLGDAVMAERSKPKRKRKRREVEVIHRRPGRAS